MKKFNLHQLSPIESYEHSVHGMARADHKNSATCTDCHGSHNLLRSSERESKLFWQNIPQTCGKCHENIAQTYSRSVHGTAVAEGIKERERALQVIGKTAQLRFREVLESLPESEAKTKGWALTEGDPADKEVYFIERTKSGNRWYHLGSALILGDQIAAVTRPTSRFLR